MRERKREFGENHGTCVDECTPLCLEEREIFSPHSLKIFIKNTHSFLSFPFCVRRLAKRLSMADTLACLPFSRRHVVRAVGQPCLGDRRMCVNINAGREQERENEKEKQEKSKKKPLVLNAIDGVVNT